MATPSNEPDTANAAPVSQHIAVDHNDHNDGFPSSLSFRCAVIDSKGPRRTMEDAHTIVVPFAGVRGQGFFAVFDGHAGKHAAEWCGQHFSLYLLQALRRHSESGIPDVLNHTFHDVDSQLSRMAEDSEGKNHSGCTAVTAFLRLEDASGKQSFIPPEFDAVQSGLDLIEAEGGEESQSGGSGGEVNEEPKKRKKSKLKERLLSIGGSRTEPTATSVSSSDKGAGLIFTPQSLTGLRRVLYCANAGDARGVLCRGGKALRLTYDHKGSDKQEAKRIVDAGGFVMSGRVNGVLAVTRSLGDSSMKEYVVGAPYTTETELSEEDEFLILACDGLWDVVNDQTAVDLVRDVADPAKASEALLDHAYKNWTSDNVTVLVVRFRNPPSKK